jgi:hypothetical protein
MQTMTTCSESVELAVLDNWGDDMLTPARRGGKQPRERRNFSIRQEVRYESLGKRGFFGVGKGTSLELSSREVRFTTEHDLRPGQKIRLAMNWPVLLDGTCRLQLQICGRVVESQHGQAAAEIVRYEFRTLRAPNSEPAASNLSKAWNRAKERETDVVRNFLKEARNVDWTGFCHKS